MNGTEVDNIGITSSSMKGVVLPNTIKYIGRNAFSGTTLLTNLEIPQSVVEVEQNILYGWLPTQSVKVFYDREADLPNGWNPLWKNGCKGVINFQGKFSIQYVLNGGTHFGNPTEYKSIDSNILNDAIKKGHTFDGWYDNAEFIGSPITIFGQGMSGDLTLYAKFEKNEYTIHYESNKPKTALKEIQGETVDSHHTYDVESALSQNGYSLYGWNFVGWGVAADSVDYEDKELVTNLTDVLDGNITLYAQWQPKQYTVIYNSNKPYNASGILTGTVEDTVFEYDKEYALSANKYSLCGWSFVGWNTKSNGSGKSYKDGESIINIPQSENSEISLYAQWKPHEYTVQYLMNAPERADVKGGSTASSTFEYDYEGVLNQNGFAITGWEFIGWNTDATGSGTSYAAGEQVKNIIRGDITDGCQSILYAQWEAILYSITFNKNGGYYETSTIQLHYRDSLPYATAPEKYGYTFAGYYATINGNQVLYYDKNMNGMISEWRDIHVTELKASWEANEYTITFLKLNGSGATDTLKVKMGEWADPVEPPVKFGYEFIGYYRAGDIIDENRYFDAEGYPIKPWDIGQDCTLYGHYTAVLTYNLNYWEQGGGIEALKTIKNMSNIPLHSVFSLTAPEHSNCVFVEWRHTSGYLGQDYEVLSTESTVYIGQNTVYDYLKSLPEGDIMAYNVYAYYETPCVDEDTLITLADGSQKAVQDLTGDEQLLVWNLLTGSFDTAPILFIDSHPQSVYEVIKLSFSDDTVVNIITEHAFWDFNLNTYVYLDQNASQYIGHWFNKQVTDSSGNFKWEKVQLISVDIFEKCTTAWSPVTYSHLCYYVNGMLSMPGGIGGLFNIFEVDAESMRYNVASMQADIEEYGLFTYEEFSELVPVSEAVFDAFNGHYLKVAIGKGLIDISTLKSLANRYSKFFVEV